MREAAPGLPTGPPFVRHDTAGRICAGGCAGPAVTCDGYRVKTAGTLNDISSALATATLAEHLEAQGRMTFALTDQSISEAESDAFSAQRYPSDTLIQPDRLGTYR